MILLATAAVAQEKKDKEPKAQKPTPVKTLLKDARASIKNKRDQKNREKTLLDALKRDDISNKEKAEIYFMVAQLEHSLNDQENLKAYLKQKYDTANYYNTMLQASQYALLCDSIDTIPDDHGKVRARFRSKNRELLMLYRPNIYQGGRFFIKKGDYGRAYEYMALYTELSRQDITNGHQKLKNDTLLGNSNFYAMLCAYNSSRPGLALKYVDDAIEYADSSRKAVLLEYKVRCLMTIDEKEEGVRVLKQGVKEYPKHDYFFVNLERWYEEERLLDDGLQLADSMLQNVQDATIYWYSKSLMYLHKEDWNNCIEMANVVLERDSAHIDALYNKAVSYINMAADFTQVACNDVRDPKYRQDRQYLQSIYRDAKHPCEELRRLRPDAVATWAPLLYRVYLNLNMGEEFNEIEKVLLELNK